MNLLEVNNLIIDFKLVGAPATKVIKGIDFAVGEDEVVGLVGKSGCGKTITALSIMRLLPPGGRIRGGRVIFQGTDLLKLSPEDMREARGKRIGMVFQEPFTSLNPIMRVGEQVREAINAHSRLDSRASKKKVLELLDRVKIAAGPRVFYDYPHQLSGGQRQRIIVAMAIALNPKLIICDEPTTALDVTIQSEILKLLLELKKELKVSILFITHDLGIVQEIAEKVLVMKDGQIVERGLVKEILASPSHSYTRELLEAALKKGIELSGRAEQERKAVIEARNISKSFSIERGLSRKRVGWIQAVKSVNLKLEKGKTLGLVGESGSGKTTLARMLIGLIKPDNGEILLEGVPLEEALENKPRSVRAMMQIVFQDPYSSLDPRMRMKDIVLEGARLSGPARLEEENVFKRSLEMVNLTHTDGLKYPHQFSGGERQRIALARALAVNPQCLILDEPVSSLDVSTQMEILKLLTQLQAKLGLTYLLVAHDLSVVKLMSHFVSVMYKGEIVESSPTEQIFHNPRHPYTRLLLESVPRLER